ncbi:RNA polymerase sigma factor [Tenacibaculum amylolyticum]|uniref:RNA polymerase sigma factor n=1 Tax=Tenacibaculum amylolyticum TaxID=104269 RepID=UPI003896599C
MLRLEKSLGYEHNFYTLFNTYYEAARNYIYYKCGNIEQAEDIVQDSFVKIWERRDTLHFEKARPYLFTICNNALRNAFDHQKVVLKYRSTTTVNYKDNESPEFLFELEDFRKKFENAISSLSEKEREVFLLSRIDKKSYKEIAEIIGISVKSVERRMSSAFVNLRSTLGEHLKF